MILIYFNQQVVGHLLREMVVDPCLSKEHDGTNYRIRYLDVTSLIKQLVAQKWK